MNNWVEKELGKIAKVKRGASPRPIEDLRWWGGDIGWVRISDVTSAKKYLYQTKNYLSPLGVSKSVRINKNDVILSICATIGRPIITKIEVCIHDGFVWFENLQDIKKEFMYYFLLFKENELASSRQMGTQGNLNTSIVSKLKVPLPPLPEQTQIAEILSTVDRAIDQTEAVIAKQQRIKTGLMQDLLTKGIDQNGNIRSEETHQFKDSPLGRIPVGWNVVRLEDVYRTPIRDFGSFSTTTLIKFLDEGIPFIKSEMIEVGRINWKSVTFISIEVHRKLTKSHVSKGVILFSKIGSALGKATIYEGEMGECNSNAAVAKIDINEKCANPHFVCYLINFTTIQNQIRNKVISLVPRLNLGDINEFLIPIPPKKEQEEVIKLLHSLDREINEKTKILTKTQKLKTGLMQDLLTGKVRVTELLKKQQEEDS